MRRTFIAIFVFLQITAVGIGSIPRGARDPLSIALRGISQHFLAPYLILTGQWQHWNLFAPDPSSRVLTLTVDRISAGRRVETWSYTPEEIEWYRRTNVLKVARHLWNPGKRFDELREAFLGSLCRERSLPRSSRLHLTVHLTDVIDRERFNHRWEDATILCSKYL